MSVEQIVTEIEKHIGKIPPVPKNCVRYSIQTKPLEQYVEEQKIQAQSFNELLFEYMDKMGFVSDADFYKKAGMDRRHFSKIKGNDNLIPRRETVMALALALELNLDDAERLLEAAGYHFFQSSTTDVIVKYCIENKHFKRGDVDEALSHFGMKPLLG